MPGSLLHVGASVQCSHVAPATIQTSNTRVFVGTTLAVTVADVCAVSGCLYSVGAKSQPCVTIRWAPSSRVFINGQPAVVQVAGSGQGICLSAELAPQGPPMIGAIQPRVIGV